MPIEIKQETFTIGLIENKLLSFQLSEYATNNKIPILFGNYEYTFQFTIQIHEKEKQISIQLDTNLLQIQEHSLKVELASMKLSCLFTIINFHDVIKRDANNAMQTPTALLQMCAAIALGSARGMYSAKLASTLYSNSVLPLLDLQKLFPQEGQVKI